jgi:hypothetical protein
MFLAPSLKVLADSSESATTETKGSEHATNTESGDQKSENSENQNEDADHDGIKDAQENAEERQLQHEFSKEEGKAKIESELKTGEKKNKFEFQLEAHEKVEFSFKFKSESSSADSQVEMKFEFRRLIEFLDNTTNPNNTLNAYDKLDTKVQELDFKTLTWKLDYNIVDISGSQVIKIVVNASQDSMLIQFTFFISPSYVNQSDYVITPNAVKFNVEISNFPFMNENSLLASEVKMKHQFEKPEEKKVEDETEDHKDGLAGEEQQLKFDNNSVGAYFSWAKTYLADGVNKTIIVSPVSSDSEEGSHAKMYFNFVHAVEYFWDPEVGVTRSTTSPYVQSLAGTSPGFEVLAIFIIPAIALISRIKKRNK